MARTGATQIPVAMTRTGAAELPTFRRATSKDAVDIAQATFLAEERVDVGVLATRLAVSRATVYRWFGTRERLLEEVLVQLAMTFGAAARAEAKGEGDERILDFARGIMNATAQFQPLRSFVEREPQLALRLLIGERGAVHVRIAQAMFEAVSETYSPEEAKALEPQLDVVVQVAATLLWATLAVGNEPQTERVVDIIRIMLAASRAAADPAAGGGIGESERAPRGQVG